jgi:hypothetical protein
MKWAITVILNRVLALAVLIWLTDSYFRATSCSVAPLTQVTKATEAFNTLVRVFDRR